MDALPFRPRHALALVPFAAVFVGVPLANRVEPYVLGLPFLLFWIVACVVATSAIMWLLATLDRRERTERAERAERGESRPAA